MNEPVGTVRALWRFPVKSMLGEELDAAELGEGGIVGDRAYAVRDRETGKVASAKHPKLWPDLLACRAAFVEPPPPGRRASPGADRSRRRQLGAERRAGCRRRPVALLRPRRGAGARRAERLHDRSVPPRRGELRSRGTPRRGRRGAARRGVLQRAGASLGCSRRLVLRPLPAQRPDDVKPGPAGRARTTRAASTPAGSA